VAVERKYVCCLIGKLYLLFWKKQSFKMINDEGDQWWSTWKNIFVDQLEYSIGRLRNEIPKFGRWTKMRSLIEWNISFVGWRKRNSKIWLSKMVELINDETDRLWWSRWKNTLVDQLEYFNWSFEKTKF
jgi:hypothetical protein